MTNKTNAARQEQSASAIRITASRLSTRSAGMLLKKISRIPEQTDILLAKESDCCSRATD